MGQKESATVQYEERTLQKPSAKPSVADYSAEKPSFAGKIPSASASNGEKTEDKQSQKPQTMPNFTAKKPSWAEVAANKQKQPSFSASSRTDSMSSTVPNLPDPMVPISSRTQLRRLSSAGRLSEPETKPEDPLIVARHSKIAIGCAVKVRGFHEKGVVRWLGLYSDKCMAGLEMERAKSFWNKTQDDKSWFTCRADHEHYENIEELELMEPEKPSNFANRLYQSSMSSAPTSLTSNRSRVVELTETNDGRIRLGSSVRTLCTRGVVRWIGIYNDREMIGLETMENTYQSTENTVEASEECSEYLPSDRVEPDIEPWQNPGSHTPGVHTSAVHSHTSSSSRSAVPSPALVIVEIHKYGDYSIGDHVLYEDVYPGIIEFMGRVKTKNGDLDNSKVHVGLDMTEVMPPHYNNETFDGFSQFTSVHHGAVYCDITQISHNQDVRSDPKVQNMYDTPKSAIVQESQCVAYWQRMSDHFLGRFKGIQGHHKSCYHRWCYLDATLYSMFAFTHAFDSVLHRPKLSSDIAEYTEIQTILREKIVNPLRRDHYVDAQKVMELRTLLDKLSSVSGMMGEEKDPGEFLNSLLNETLKADPFIKLSSGQEAFLYQLFLEKTENLTQPTTQELIDMSFEQSKIKLKEAPSCLIVQMPRFGRNYKMFDKILPSPEIDITKLIEPPQHKCCLCMEDFYYDWYTCLDCGVKKQCAVDYCYKCWRQHQENKRHQDHRGYLVNGVDEQMMELFSVVCVENSHYVAFTKCAPQKWVFFDSMADRIGYQHGFNIPEVSPCMDVGDPCEMLHFCNDVPLARRVLQDAYFWFYRSVNTSMYC